MWNSTVCLVDVIKWIFCFCYSQLDEIIRDSTPPAYGEEHLAALTAGERTLWAEAREEYFSSGVNRSSLEAIEKSAFVLILDDEEYNIGSVRLFY
jgi:carnitine O-palmitoyltransferase 1